MKRVNLLLGSLDENFEWDASKKLQAAVGKVLLGPDIFLCAGDNYLTAKDFRRIALSMPEAVEGSHFGHADFRVGGKIFATLSLESEGFGVLLLTPDQQAGMVEDEPEIFSPVPKGWGRMGATRVRLAKVAPDILTGALRVAWERRAPRRLVRPKSGI